MTMEAPRECPGSAAPPCGNYGRGEGAAVKVAIATLGCKVNQYESAGMAATLRENGFTPVAFGAPADVCIVNTCIVTGKAAYQSRQLIRRALKHNPAAEVLVTGCYAQVLPEEVAAISGVKMVAGNLEKDNILPIVHEMARGGKKICRSDVRRAREFTTPAARGFAGRTRGLLKIQDGCDTFCRYCIVPYARGKSRSLAASEVLGRLAELEQAGYRELALTGVNLGAYGRDLCPATNLLALLRQVEDARPLSRLRLSSLEPGEITEEILSFFREQEVFCPHFHIPLQSCDDRVLALMGRDYDTLFIRRLIEKILAYLPDAAIGADIMVGFPGEGEAAFAGTKMVLADLPLAYLHVFRYSPRPGTPAASLPGKVQEAEKKKRGDILRELSEKKRARFAEKFLGRRLKVLLEGEPDKKTGMMRGFSSNYIPVVVVNGDAARADTLVEVETYEAREGKLFGRML